MAKSQEGQKKQAKKEPVHKDIKAKRAAKAAKQKDKGK